MIDYVKNILFFTIHSYLFYNNLVMKILLKRILFLLFPVFTLVVGLHPDKHSLLKINASIAPKRLDKGQEGNIVLKFNLEDGVTVSPQPSFTIELNSSEELIFSKDFFTASDLEMGILKENGYEYLDRTRKS